MNIHAEFVLYGRVPSKKNSRWTKVINGKPIQLPSKKYQDWHKEQLKVIGASGIGAYRNIKGVQITMYAPDKIRADLTNKAESIMDLMVDAGIIEDDNWFVIPEVVLVFGGVDRENPRAEVIIKK